MTVLDLPLSTIGLPAFIRCKVANSTQARNSRPIYNTTSQLIQTHGRSLLWLGFTLLVPLTMSGIVTSLVLQQEPWLSGLTPPNWALVFLAASLAMGLALVPTTFIALLTGYVLGWAGLVPMIASYLLASAIGYVISSAIDGDRLLHSLSQFPKTSSAIQRLQARQRGIVFFGRISPLLPFAMMNLVLPALGVRFWTFIWAGFLGMLPRTVLMVWVGIQASGLRDALDTGSGDTTAMAVTLLLTVTSLLGLGYMARQTFR